MECGWLPCKVRRGKVRGGKFEGCDVLVGEEMDEWGWWMGGE